MSRSPRLTFVPPSTPLIARPKNGLFSDPDSIGRAKTWARAEIRAEVDLFGRQGHTQRLFAKQFLKEYGADGLDQCSDLTGCPPLAVTSTRFINVFPLPLPAEDAGGAAVDGCAWEEVIQVADDTLLDAYRHCFQVNLDRGDSGALTGVGVDAGL